MRSVKPDCLINLSAAVSNMQFRSEMTEF